MSTFRIPQEPMPTRMGPPGVPARALALSLLLCATVFACCFAIGRAERPAGTPEERLPPSISAASAGTPIPVALSAAPPIDNIEQAKVSAAPVLTAIPVLAPRTVASPISPRSLTPVAPPATVAPTVPVEAPAPKAPAAPAPTSSGGRSSTGGTSPPAGGGTSGNHKPATKSETSSSSSFVSSG